MLSYWSAGVKLDSSFYHFISNTITQYGVKRAKNLECQTMRLNPELYYISQLVRTLWLVNFAGRILLYGPLC